MNVKDVEKLLGSYAELFNITVKEGYVIAKPKKYIDSKMFSDIGKLVKQENGEYVKLDKATGEGGHFRFKSEGAVSTVTSDKKDLPLKDIWAYADNIEKQARIIKEKLKELQK